MFEGLALRDIIDFGVSGVVVFAVIGGFLLPRWTHIQRINDLKEQRDEYKAMVQTLIGNQDVTLKILTEIRNEAAKR